jgi:hypothetical protein
MSVFEYGVFNLRPWAVENGARTTVRLLPPAPSTFVYRHADCQREKELVAKVEAVLEGHGFQLAATLFPDKQRAPVSGATVDHSRLHRLTRLRAHHHDERQTRGWQLRFKPGQWQHSDCVEAPQSRNSMSKEQFRSGLAPTPSMGCWNSIQQKWTYSTSFRPTWISGLVEHLRFSGEDGKQGR